MEVCGWRLKMFIGWPLYWKFVVGCSLPVRLANWLSGWSAHQTTPCSLRSIATWNLKAMRAKKQQIWVMWKLQSFFFQTQTQTRTQKERHREGIANQRASHVQSAQTNKQTNTQNSIVLNDPFLVHVNEKATCAESRAGLSEASVVDSQDLQKASAQTQRRKCNVTLLRRTN